MTLFIIGFLTATFIIFLLTVIYMATHDPEKLCRSYQSNDEKP